MTLKEFKVQRALGTAGNSYSITPDNFFGKVEFTDAPPIIIPYQVWIKLTSYIDPPSQEWLFNYIETQLR